MLPPEKFASGLVLFVAGKKAVSHKRIVPANHLPKIVRRLPHNRKSRDFPNLCSRGTALSCRLAVPSASLPHLRGSFVHDQVTYPRIASQCAREQTKSRKILSLSKKYSRSEQDIFASQFFRAFQFYSVMRLPRPVLQCVRYLCFLSFSPLEDTTGLLPVCFFGCALPLRGGIWLYPRRSKACCRCLVAFIGREGDALSPPISQRSRISASLF